MLGGLDVGYCSCIVDKHPMKLLLDGMQESLDRNELATGLWIRQLANVARRRQFSRDL